MAPILPDQKITHTGDECGLFEGFCFNTLFPGINLSTIVSKQIGQVP